MVVAAGCTPVFCDVREDTFQIDPEDIARKITPKTKAIACTHLYGCPVDIASVEQLAKQHNLTVIYDAAQAHLARYNNRGIGAYGDAVTYSFYATKNLATGEGGMVTTNDEGVARRMALLRSHGETGKYLHESIGFNYRMNDITAAIGCSRLNRLERQTRARQQAAKRFDAILSEIPGLIPPTVTPKAEAVWHLYTVKMDLAKFSCTRDAFCEALKAEGVPTAVHYPRATSRQPAFKQFVKQHPPVADSLSERVFCLPMHHDLMEQHFGVVERSLRKVSEGLR
jgi:perosamine synthetase